LEERIRAIMAETLRLPVERIGADAAMGRLPNWDSTAHMRLMLALEDAFDVVLDPGRMVEMTSLAKIRAAIEALKSAKPA
jgi:acyl carrier protein